MQKSLVNVQKLLAATSVSLNCSGILPKTEGTSYTIPGIQLNGTCRHAADSPLYSQ